MMSIFKNRRTRPQTGGPKVHVCGHRDGLRLEIEKHDGSKDFVLLKSSPVLQVSVQCTSGTGPAAVVVRSPGAVWNHTAATDAEAQRLYAEIRRKVTPRSARARWAAALAVVAAMVALVTLDSDGGATATASPVAAAPAPAAAPPANTTAAAAAAPNGSAPGAVVTPEERKLVEALAGKIARPVSGPTYYVFSDPNCPYCRELEPSLEAVKGYTPVVLPLGYKAGSRELSASALCAADPAKEWSAILAGRATATKPCDKGLAQVDENMRAFEALRLVSTPTMITPSGTLIKGAATATELSAILAM